MAKQAAGPTQLPPERRVKIRPAVPLAADVVKVAGQVTLTPEGTVVPESKMTLVGVVAMSPNTVVPAATAVRKAFGNSGATAFSSENVKVAGIDSVTPELCEPTPGTVTPAPALMVFCAVATVVITGAGSAVATFEETVAVMVPVAAIEVASTRRFLMRKAEPTPVGARIPVAEAEAVPACCTVTVMTVCGVPPGAKPTVELARIVKPARPALSYTSKFALLAALIDDGLVSVTL